MSDNNTTTDILTTLKASDEAHLAAVMAALPHPGEWNTPHPNDGGRSAGQGPERDSPEPKSQYRMTLKGSPPRLSPHLVPRRGGLSR